MKGWVPEARSYSGKKLSAALQQIKSMNSHIL